MKFCRLLIASLLIIAGSSLTAGAQTTKYWDPDVDGGTGGTGTATPSGTWDTGTTANWNTTSDGTGATTTWTAGDSAVFSAGNDATGSYTVTISGSQSLTGLTMDEGTIITTSGGTLDFGATVGAPINIATGTFSEAAGTVFAGTRGLVKSGTGTLMLRGTNTNSNTVGAGTNPYLTINGGTVDFTADLNLGAAPAANTTTGVLTIDGGTLKFTGTTAVTTNVNRNWRIGANGATIDVSSTANTGLSMPSAASGTLILTNAAGAVITKTGAGRFTLNTTQSGYTGKYKILGGTISVGGDGRFGAVPGATTADYFILDGGGIRQGAATTLALDAKRGITLGAGGGTLYSPGDTFLITVNGIIAGTSGGALNIAKTGPEGGTSTGNGVVTLVGANTYNGATNIAGTTTLKSGAAGVIPDTSVVTTQASGATFDMNGFDETIKSMSGTAGIFALGTKTLTLDNPNGETYSSSITGVGGGKLVKNGSGNFILSASTGTYDGGMTLNAGKLGIGGNAALGTGTFTIGNNNSVTAANAGTGGRAPTPSGVVLNGNMTADDTFNATPGTFTWGATVPWTINGATRTVNVNTAGGNYLYTINGIVGQDAAGRGITKTGNGILALNNSANTYSGPTQIDAGNINLDGDGTLGDGTGNVILNGGTLNASASRSGGGGVVLNPVQILASSSITCSATAATPIFDFSGAVTGTAGQVLTFQDNSNTATLFKPRFSGGSFTFASDISMLTGTGTLAALVQFESYNTTGTTQTYTGVISGTGSFNRSASIGGTAGTTVFTAQNTYSGGTLLGDGTLEFGVDSVGPANAPTSGPVGTGTITVNNINSPKLAANGAARNVGNGIAFGGGSVLGITGSNNLTLTGDVNLGAAARTINVDNSGQTVMSGTISGAGGSLTKDLGGVLTVTGNNTYDTGTVVNAGFLLVNNTSGSGTGTGPVTVNSNGVLGGTGTIGGAIANSGVIAPGDGDIGTLSVGGDVTNSTGAIWHIELSGATSDKLAVTGNIDLLASGDFLSVTGSGTGSSWLIGTYTGIESGVFDNITSGYTVDYSGGNITLNAVVAGLPGDFNSDGKVDAGDYATWRKAFDGSPTAPNAALANDGGLGTPITTAHYDLWRANFGNPPGAGSGGGLGSNAAVPEPSTILLLAMGLLTLGMPRPRQPLRRSAKVE